MQNKRPAYFCFFIEACNMISLLDIESAGKVIHAVSDYFSDGKEPEELSRNENTVFTRIKRDVDESFKRYNEAVKNGKKGAAKRYSNDSL